MLMYEDSLGIDVRSDGVHAVILGKSFKGYHLLDSLVLRLDNEMPADNIEEDIVVALRDFVVKNRFGNGPVQVGIPRRHAMVRFFKVPILPLDDIRKLVKYEASRHVPGDLNDYVYDIHIVDEKIGVGMRVLFVAVARKTMEAYLSLMKRAGLHPDVLDISSINAMNAICSDIRGLSNDDVIAYMQLGAQDVEIVLLRGQQIQLTRSMAIQAPYLGENGVTTTAQPLVENLSVPNEDVPNEDVEAQPLVEDLSVPYENVVPHGDVPVEDLSVPDHMSWERESQQSPGETETPAIDGRFFVETDGNLEFGVGIADEDVASNSELTGDVIPEIHNKNASSEEIEAAFDDYVGQLEFALKDSMALAGLTSEGQQTVHRLLINKSPWTRPRVIRELQLHSGSGTVQCLNGFERLRLKNVIDDEAGQSDLHSAMGLALRSYHEGRFFMNLLAPEMRPIRKRTGFWISISLTVFIVLSLFSMIGLGYYKDVQLLEQMKKQITLFQPEVERINALRDQARQGRELLTTFNELALRRSLELEILVDVTNRLPDGYWLNYLMLDKERLTIHGEGESPESLVQLLDASPWLEGVKLERVVNERFTIETQITEPILSNGRDKPESELTNGEKAQHEQTSETVGSGVGVGPAEPKTEHGEVKGAPEDTSPSVPNDVGAEVPTHSEDSGDRPAEKRNVLPMHQQRSQDPILNKSNSSNARGQRSFRDRISNDPLTDADEKRRPPSSALAPFDESKLRDKADEGTALSADDPVHHPLPLEEP